jgi:hypothetical protein
MTTPELTIEIDATTRYAAYLDTEFFDYLHDWDHDSWGLFTLAIDRQYRPLKLDTFGINDRLQKVVDWYSFSWNDNTLDRQLEKAITRAGYSSRQFSLKGYSQSDWAYVVLYWRDDAISDITGVIEELEAWFRGDVYTIALEKLETYKSESGSEKHYWESVDSIGQVILTDSYRFTAETCSELLYAADIVAA